MLFFCTRCGVRSEASVAFCDNCGAAFRGTPVVGATAGGGIGAPAAKPAVSAKSGKLIYVIAGLFGLLIVGSGAMYFVLQPPAASSGTLLAAAKAGYGKSATDTFKRELCLSNTDYSSNIFNAGENDGRTQAWMNALVAAGLYSPPVAINSGGYFPRTLLQYVATPDLANYREGSWLCLAKDVEIGDVVEIGKPIEESVGRDGGRVKVLAVKATLVLQSTGNAPWLEKPEVRDALLAAISGWEYKDKKLQKQVADSFGLHEKQWTTGPAYKTLLEKQHRAAQRSRSKQDSEYTSSNGPDKGLFGGISSALSSLFSFGGHPLKGAWRMDTEGIGQSLGMRLPRGLGLDVTMAFTADSITMGGQSMKSTFEVDGDRVKVTPEGQPVSLIFVMLDRDTAMVDMGLIKVQYKRVN